MVARPRAVRTGAIGVSFAMMTVLLHAPARAQAHGSLGEATVGLVGGAVVGSLLGLSFSTAEARLFNRYVFGLEGGARRLALFASIGAFAGFGLGAIDAAELRHLGGYVGAVGGIGTVAGTLVGSVLRAPQGAVAGAYVGTGVGILAGVVVGLLDPPNRKASSSDAVPSRTRIPIGVRVPF